jgi:hypothetical protein
VERASGTINEERERSELEAVLASTLFARAPDLSKILKYVCEKHFANQDDERNTTSHWALWGVAQIFGRRRTVL